MSKWWFLLAGVVLGGPLWVALTLYAGRRLWRSARRLTARSRGREHLAELGRLTAGLAHEIKNPLSTINVNLQLLAEDLARHDDELHRRWLRRLDSARAETDRVRDILDDFLRYAGHYELHRSPVDLRRLLEELLDFFGPQAEVAQVLMRVTLPDQPLRCNVDANLIKQAILNLLINAVQAMQRGGELLAKLSAGRQEAIIEVIDTGAGMDDETMAKIFQAYYSTKQGGSGLGLPMTRRIIREHGGTVRVESDPGKGTRFIIALPLADD